MPLSKLIDPSVTDEDLAKEVRTVTAKPASDGLHEAPDDVLLATDFENARVTAYRGSVGKTVFQAKPYEWPDTLALGPNGRVYVVLNQLQRQKNYHEGKDLRKKPYTLVSFRYR